MSQSSTGYALTNELYKALSFLHNYFTTTCKCKRFSCIELTSGEVYKSLRLNTIYLWRNGNAFHKLHLKKYLFVYQCGTDFRKYWQSLTATTFLTCDTQETLCLYYVIIGTDLFIYLMLKIIKEQEQLRTCQSQIVAVLLPTQFPKVIILSWKFSGTSQFNTYGCRQGHAPDQANVYITFSRLPGRNRPVFLFNQRLSSRLNIPKLFEKCFFALQHQSSQLHNCLWSEVGTVSIYKNFTPTLFISESSNSF